MPQEPIIFQSGDVTITTSRAVFRNTSYVISNISSVRLEQSGGCLFTLVTFFVLGGASVFLAAILFLAGRLLFLGAGRGADPISFDVAFGLMLLLAGISAWYIGRTTYTIELRIGGADRAIYAFTSHDRDQTRSIVDAINQAIVRQSHGRA